MTICRSPACSPFWVLALSCFLSWPTAAPPVVSCAAARVDSSTSSMPEVSRLCFGFESGDLISSQWHAPLLMDQHKPHQVIHAFIHVLSGVRFRWIFDEWSSSHVTYRSAVICIGLFVLIECKFLVIIFILDASLTTTVTLCLREVLRW